MVSLLLVIIYIAFISLGLPDALLGSAWPVVQVEFGVPLSYAGIITMIICAGTIASSLSSDWLTRKIGTGLVVAISVALTALSMLAFSFATTFAMLCIFAIPYGLGAGAIDAALNNYVAIHYKSSHMNWLHGCWGIGAAVSPYIMSMYLIAGDNWRNGYSTVSYIQIGITLLIFLSLPLWKKSADIDTQKNVKSNHLGVIGAIKIPGVWMVMVYFLCYCALETTAGLWATSYLSLHRGIDANTAARYASFFYIGITAGRLTCGFFSNKIGDKNIIRLGLAILLVGIALVIIPVDIVCLIGLIVIGIGCAPIYPATVHATPHNFGEANSQSIIGIQMASAYVGTTFAPPLFGLIAQYISISLFPYYLIVFAVAMVVLTEMLNRKLSNKLPTIDNNNTSFG